MRKNGISKILGIETSCDDTCAAVVELSAAAETSPFGRFDPARSRLNILSNIVSSQTKLHEKYGGVFPSLAKREHQRNLAAVTAQAIRSSGLKKMPKEKLSKEDLSEKVKNLKMIFGKEDDFFLSSAEFLKKTGKPDVEAIAVTIGPGLEPSLWQGINFARAASSWWNLPIIPVNHIEGHIAANFIDQKKNANADIFPAVCLIASGGHTQLVLMKGIRKYETLGESRDDAAGECFDKAARILGLGYPGGPAIAKAAKKFDHQDPDLKIKLPRPMMFTKDYDFSFSGLKTAVLYDFKKRPEKMQRSKNYAKAMAHEIQEAIVEVMVYKTLKAARTLQARSIITGGGVTASERLSSRFRSEIAKLYIQPDLLVPAKDLSADNAAMIAAAAFFDPDKISGWKKMEADANLRI
ncbi:MAG: tRNA (adenosine(37)-N6)-threonylcarbamoyltransferase complex transferase subunit TsaD [Candidatus Paceibacterota bacterium]|jgi:N6-L-threonylcarbamoyladenine synthase